MWPSLPYKKWKDTKNTLHMWMQIIGKVKLELSPFLNQWWEVAFYVSATGITTGKIPYNGELLQIDFDFQKHILIFSTSWGKQNTLPLKPQTVATFYGQFTKTLKSMGIDVSIWPTPVEVENPIPFAKDTTHLSYDNKYVEQWWHILVKTIVVFEQFRTSFRCKSSPVQFYWGSFDLNSTRFSGKKVTPPAYRGTMGKIMKYAENEENFAFGFWPGDEKFPHPAFYSYLYPQPSGFDTISLSDGASFNEKLGECILPYEIVIKSNTPEKVLMHFLDSTYHESAKLAKWDMKALHTEVPVIH